jgi:hypothetical protein
MEERACSEAFREVGFFTLLYIVYSRSRNGARQEGTWRENKKNTM